jgi:hypothetical protein
MKLGSRSLSFYLSHPRTFISTFFNFLSSKKARFKDLWLFPSVEPTLPLWKIISDKARFNFYNKFFLHCPVGSSLIRCSDIIENCSSSPAVDQIINRASNLNLNALIDNGFLVVSNAINSPSYSGFCKELTKNCNINDSKTRKLSYNGSTYFHYFDSSWLKYSQYFSSVKDLVDDVSKDLFGEGYNPDIGIQCINAFDVDSKDPNTIPHIDRFVPCLKAFYFPFDVEISGAPFAFAPGSHLINNFYRSSYMESLEKRRNPKPFQMPSKFLAHFNLKSFNVPANTLIFAFTNGIHCRTPFKTFPAERWSIAFYWYNSLTKAKILQLRHVNSQA